MRPACLMVGCLLLPHLLLDPPATSAGDGPDSAVVAAPTEVPLPNRVDLRPLFERYGLEPRVQGGRPTCSVFTVVGALEFAAARQLGQGTRLSVEFLNWAANQTGGRAVDGGFFSDLWRGFARYGVCREASMPYQPAFDPAQSPTAAMLAEAKDRCALGLRLHWIKEWDVHSGLTAAQYMGVKRALAQGWPVCGGFRWPKREQWVEEVLQMCPAEAVRDGHSVLLVGYRDDPAQPGGGVFVFRNTSHGGRDGSMPYDYARTYMNDALWVDGEAVIPHAVNP